MFWLVVGIIGIVSFIVSFVSLWVIYSCRNSSIQEYKD